VSQSHPGIGPRGSAQRPRGLEAAAHWSAAHWGSTWRAPPATAAPAFAGLRTLPGFMRNTFAGRGSDASHRSTSCRDLVGQPEYPVAWPDQDRHHPGPKFMPTGGSPTEVGTYEIPRTGCARLLVRQLQLISTVSR
jgi:hypothetical protein